MKVFLGGTVNGSAWRKTLIQKLEVDYFDPVVEDWNDEAWAREVREREECDYCLYVLTPKMTGFYSLAEVMDDSFHRPEKVIYYYKLYDDGASFYEDEIKALKELGKKVEENGGVWLRTMQEVQDYLNSRGEKNPVKKG